MRRSIPLLFLAIILLFFQPLPASGQDAFPLNYISATLDEKILAAESLVMARQYDEARSLFNALEEEAPESLLPSMGRLLILMVHSMERGAPVQELEESFGVEFRKNRKAMKRMESKEDLSAWDHFLMGGSLGVQGLYELEKNRYFAAFMHGLSALSHFNKAQEMDPEIHDTHFAGGLYKYFRSVKTRYLWFLPLIRDQREEGIEEIRLALKRGRYAVPACKIALVFLAEKQGKDEEGLLLGETFLKEYPKCLMIVDPLAKIYRRTGRPLEAAQTYGNAYDGDVSVRWLLLEAGREFLRADALGQAEASFQAFLASGPDSSEAAQARLGLSRIYRSRGNELRSKEEWERAVQLDPSLKEEHPR